MTRIVDQFLIKIILEYDENWKVWKHVDDAAGEDAAQSFIWWNQSMAVKLVMEVYMSIYIYKCNVLNWKSQMFVVQKVYTAPSLFFHEIMHFCLKRTNQAHG